MSSNRRAVAIAEQAIAADPGEEQVDVPVGVEVARRDAEAGAVLRAARTSRNASSKRPSPLFRSKASRIPFGPITAEVRIEVEPAVAIGVESGDRRAEAGSHPADDGRRAGEVRWS